MAVYTHSEILFTNIDGTPMRFYMRPCDERAILKPLVQHGGGIISSEQNKDSIKIAQAGSHVKSDDYINSAFISDSIKDNILQDMEKYRLKPGDVAQENMISTTSEVVDEEDMEPASYIIQMTAKDRRGRKKYMLSEEVNIIKYLVENRLQSSTGGNKVWKDLQKLEIAPHSWQSMKDRYKRHILPNIDSYNVPNHWKSLLSAGSCVGGTSMESSKAAMARYLAPVTVSTPPQERSESESENDIFEISEENQEEIPNEIDDFDNRLLDIVNSQSQKHKNSDQKSRIETRSKDLVRDGDSSQNSGSLLNKNGTSHSSQNKQQRNKVQSEPMLWTSERICASSSTDVEVMEKASSPARRNRIVTRSQDIVRDSDSSENSDSLLNENGKRPSSHKRQQENELPSRSMLRSSKRFCATSSTDAEVMEKAAVDQSLEETMEPDSSQDSFNNAQKDSSPARKKKHAGKIGISKFVIGGEGGTQTGQETESQEVSQMEEDLDPVVVSQCNEAVETLMEKFNFEREEATTLLYMNGGSVGDTIHFILHGTNLKGCSSWTSEDDRILQSANHNDIKRLKLKFTTDDINKRAEFLEHMQ